MLQLLKMYRRKLTIILGYSPRHSNQPQGSHCVHLTQSEHLPPLQTASNLPSSNPHPATQFPPLIECEYTRQKTEDRRHTPKSMNANPLISFNISKPAYILLKDRLRWNMLIHQNTNLVVTDQMKTSTIQKVPLLLLYVNKLASIFPVHEIITTNNGLVTPAIHHTVIDDGIVFIYDIYISLYFVTICWYLLPRNCVWIYL